MCSTEEPRTKIATGASTGRHAAAAMSRLARPWRRTEENCSRAILEADRSRHGYIRVTARRIPSSAECRVSCHRPLDAPQHSRLQGSAEQRGVRSCLYTSGPEECHAAGPRSKCDRAFPVKARTFDAFDFLIIVFLNIVNFYRRRAIEPRMGAKEPEFFTLPRSFVQKHHYVVASGWEKVRTKGLDIEKYRNEAGFELVASALRAPYPARAAAA
jgi:hypothetical protein